MAYMIPPNGNFCLRHARQVLPVACEYAPQVLLPYSHFTIAMLSPCVHHPHGMALVIVFFGSRQAVKATHS